MTFVLVLITGILFLLRCALQARMDLCRTEPATVIVNREIPSTNLIALLWAFCLIAGCSLLMMEQPSAWRWSDNPASTDWKANRAAGTSGILGSRKTKPPTAGRIADRTWALGESRGLEPRGSGGVRLSVVVGLICIGTGSVIGTLGMATLDKNYSRNVCIFRNHRLVTEGIYSVLRHPIRLGIILEAVGFCSFLPLLVAPVIPLTLTLLLVRRSKFEDELLCDHFGGRAVEYQERVPAFNILAGCFRLITGWKHRLAPTIQSSLKGARSTTAACPLRPSNAR